MRILFLTDNFPPEVNAPASRTYEHCKEWVKKGVDVTVITCVPNFPKGEVFNGYKNKFYQKEIKDGIKVIRVWTFISANEGLIKRIMDYVSFMFSSFVAGLFVKTDIIIATSPQFFTAISGRWLSFWKRKKWIMEVRDLWPESIKSVEAMNDNLVIKFFEYLESRMYKKATRVIVVTDSFKQIIQNKYQVSDKKIHVIKNGVDIKKFKNREKDQKLLAELRIEDKTTVGYIGTHGLAHGLDFIFNNIPKDDKLHFLFIGDGAKRNELAALKNKLDLKNITMLSSVPKEEVDNYISILDVALVNLKRSDTFKSVIPSKIFEMASMGKPILLGVDGEAKEIIESYNIGKFFQPENPEDFREKLKIILKSDDYALGQEKIRKDFNRKDLALKMLEVIQSAVQTN